jgi:hypothetical protein
LEVEIPTKQMVSKETSGWERSQGGKGTLLSRVVRCIVQEEVSNSMPETEFLATAFLN